MGRQKKSKEIKSPEKKREKLADIFTDKIKKKTQSREVRHEKS